MKPFIPANGRIDGQPAQLHIANVGFQGLVVESGHHHIGMRYRNPLVVACAWISSMSALLLIVSGLTANFIAENRRRRGDVE
ncbi:MAG: hypothetical protein NVSMB68_08440 [Thermoanaerobaculia bacterium]